jgi:cleavage stimulation factor subunit 3
MAVADVEADFISSRQAMNNINGSEQAPGAASDQQSDSSSDEYDPPQALQYFVPDHSSSVDVSTHALPSSLSSVPVTDQAFQETYSPKAESHSRSMSGASSSSTEGRPENPTSTDETRRSEGVQEQKGDVEQSEVDGGLDIGRDVTAPLSHSVPNSPIHNLPPKDVSIQKDVQDHSSSTVVENGIVHSVPNLAVLLSDVKALPRIDAPADTSLSVPQVKETVSSTTEPTMTPNTAAPRVRLPHDRIGILEDRVKEDPRGALEAWLNLIGEHRKRGKIEDARNAYERFLHVFPSAVSMPQSSIVLCVC